jgi:Skp family chaperone for outer membrane proteins
MVAVIVEFATSTGYAMVFDTSTSQAPLLYAENATDITSEVIAAYETRHKSAER